MTKKLDLTGKKFGKLTVIKEATGSEKRSYVRWLCLCECGVEKYIARCSLISGDSISCGCFRNQCVSLRRRTHGLSRTVEYYAWKNMRNRCYNTKDIGYHNYGGRGITICPEWGTFENFLSDMGLCPEGYSLDRKNNDLGYSKENCKWSTRVEQNLNTRQNVFLTYEGKSQTISEWSKELGINRSTITYRLKMGKDIGEILKQT